MTKKVLPIKMAGPLLEQIEEEQQSNSSSYSSSESEDSSSSSSYYSEKDAVSISSDYQINHGEEEKEEESMTLNHIEEEEAKVTVMPLLRNATDTALGKNGKGMDDILLMDDSKMLEVFSNDTDDHLDKAIHKIVTFKEKDDSTPFASASSFVTNSNPSKKTEKEPSQMEEEK